MAQGAWLLHPHQLRRWHLDAAADYLDVVTGFAEELAELPITARGLRRWRELLTGYVGGTEFTELATRVREVRRALDAVRYSIEAKTGPAPRFPVLRYCLHGE